MDELIGPNVKIVLEVIEGQQFGFLQNPVYVLASLNGFILESNSVGPCDNPAFGTNLIWQADKKGLRLMRTGNIPLKVECFTTNQQNCKERIGYLLLNLRAIQILPSGKASQIKQSWNKLMGVKNEAKAHRPEILLSFYVEDDDKLEAEEPCCENITNIVPPSAINAVSPQRGVPTIVPRLCSEEGLIQIGPEDTCTDIFLLSILIGTAANLDMLLTDSQQQSGDATESTGTYSFWYSIFGHFIQTKPFNKNLSEPCTLNEKIVLRLRSSLRVLKIYFTEVSLMFLKLICGTNEIGYANMELKNLVPTEKLTEFFTLYAINNTVTQNQRCYLHTTHGGRTPTDMHGRKPFINMEVKLKYVQPPKDTYNGDTMRDVTLRSTSLTGLEPKAVSSCYQEPTPRVLNEGGDYNPTNLTVNAFNKISPKPPGASSSASTGNILNPKVNANFPHVTQSTDSALKPGLVGGLTLSPRTIAETHRDQLEVYHHYGLNIGVKSLTLQNNAKCLNKHIQLIFHHPKAAEVIYSTHPAIYVTDFQDSIHLHDNVKCRINFVSTPEEIGRLLLAWPPKISLCERSCTNDTKFPTLLGETSLDTSLLFQEEANVDYTANLLEPITKAIVGEIKIAMFIEDYGVKENKDIVNSDHVLGPPILDERIAYKLVEELEDWKERQQEMFKVELKRKEESRLLLLSTEWNVRRAELEAKLSHGVEKCRILASNLSKATEEQRIRSVKHLEAENKFRKLKEELEQSFGMKHQDLREATRRLDDEYTHKLNVIKNENLELTVKISALERENALLKDTIKKHEAQLDDLRKTSLTKDQTSTLLQEQRALEEKLEASTKSKAFFKEEWGKAVREIHRMKAEHQKQLQTQIRLNKQELSSLGLKNFLNEEEAELKKDRNVLSQIRSDLQNLKMSEQNIQSFNFNDENINYTTSRPDLLEMDSEEKIAMLIEERDALLRTGSYSEQDPVIIKLNQELQQTINH
ncbi:centrosomal protein of 120 kDa-like, partial [Chrysoperla carnea]|uniref:centrosomal protein of 120 kDa-like n=1 Tax=Chrysoperla carnea TaxID=189513 RepID=UPI001D084CFC